ncbi:hypothetical protein M2165_000149 [Variovorax sp. TBS-050B]|uniref:hypothetical protein n=1 Tax=Variovorax sp. TBS-050B TaxID=2940551 RepID=UPI002474D862|nr:hypothetical protein [Variovorax sp. TBS-050B]MDH6590260.1 hypothetical protein [Variovorax sp. TBS-050B]
MVIVRQHGEAGQLFDISSFLADVDCFFRPEQWQISVESCLGSNALSIEEASFPGLCLSDAEFRSLYRGIYQTIDGRFCGFAKGQRLFEFVVVDSSYWEVTGPPAFEAHILATYGAWNR